MFTFALLQKQSEQKDQKDQIDGEKNRLILLYVLIWPSNSGWQEVDCK